MLDKLTDLVKHYAGEPIINNADIPNERNEEAVQEASHSIFNGLQDAVAGGRQSELTDLLNNGESGIAQSALANNIQGGFVENLMRKFGLDQGKAAGIAASLIPVVLNKFINKTNDPSDNSFDLSKILAGFTGGGTQANNNSDGNGFGGGLLDKVKGMFN